MAKLASARLLLIHISGGAKGPEAVHLKKNGVMVLKQNPKFLLFCGFKCSERKSRTKLFGFSGLFCLVLPNTLGSLLNENRFRGKYKNVSHS